MQKYQLRLYGVNVLITLILVLAAMVLVKRQMPPSIVKVDLVAITSHYSELMLKQSNNTAAIKKISETVKSNLEPMLAAYATDNHVLILQAQALVDTTTPDITNEIIDELDQKIKG